MSRWVDQRRSRLLLIAGVVTLVTYFIPWGWNTTEGILFSGNVLQLFGGSGWFWGLFPFLAGLALLLASRKWVPEKTVVQLVLAVGFGPVFWDGISPMWSDSRILAKIMPSHELAWMFCLAIFIMFYALRRTIAVSHFRKLVILFAGGALLIWIKGLFSDFPYSEWFKKGDEISGILVDIKFFLELALVPLAISLLWKKEPNKYFILGVFLAICIFVVKPFVTCVESLFQGAGFQGFVAGLHYPLWNFIWTACLLWGSVKIGLFGGGKSRSSLAST